LKPRPLRYKLRMMLNYAGRGGIMVAEGPGALHPLQWPMRDLADFQTLQLTKTSPTPTVPPGLLDPQDANLNGIKMAQYLHARYAGVKRLRRIESALNAFLLPKYDPSGRLFVCYDSPVPEDRAELREESKVLIAAGRSRATSCAGGTGWRSWRGGRGRSWSSRGASDEGPRRTDQWGRGDGTLCADG